MKTNFKILVTVFTFVGFLFLTGCHTTEGFGQDVEKGGQAIQKAAKD